MIIFISSCMFVYRRMDEKEVNNYKGRFCKVLAIVESKMNVDDIGSAFTGYHRALLWLCGLRDKYDPELRKNRSYPTGHFDKPIYCNHNGEMLVLTEKSFSQTMVDGSAYTSKGLWRLLFSNSYSYIFKAKSFFKFVFKAMKRERN